MNGQKHQYIERHTRAVRTERLRGDAFVRALYSDALERAPWLFRMATSRRLSSALAFLNYDTFIGARITGTLRFMRECGVNLDECLLPPHSLDTPRKIFERQIRYRECRPLPLDPSAIVCPADSRVLVGSLGEASALFIKGKFFDHEELLGVGRRDWPGAFNGGDFAVFRLTPEKYHYVHAPVSGTVVDFYELEGRYHSCNPGALVRTISAHSKNRRSVTIVQTDVEDGSGVGLVAIVEVAALMIGQVVQCYSDEEYLSPRAVAPGMYIKRGQPKCLFRPGGSTVVLLFERGRVRFAEDIVGNLQRRDVHSRFSLGLGQTLVETETAVRSLLATPVNKLAPDDNGRASILENRTSQAEVAHVA